MPEEQRNKIINSTFKTIGFGEICQYTNRKGITSHCHDTQLQQLGGKLTGRFASTLFDAEVEREFEVDVLVAAQLYFYTTEHNDKVSQNVSISKVQTTN